MITKSTYSMKIDVGSHGTWRIKCPIPRKICHCRLKRVGGGRGLWVLTLLIELSHLLIVKNTANKEAMAQGNGDTEEKDPLGAPQLQACSLVCSGVGGVAPVKAGKNPNNAPQSMALVTSTTCYSKGVGWGGLGAGQDPEML